jgi:sulfhydrogenase subunit beta (sulfur reductase)
MKVLTQAQLEAWLNDLAKKVNLVAPVNQEGKTMYKSLAGIGNPASAVAWDFERTDMSPKTWLFPATEPILTVEQGTQTRVLEAPAPAPTVLFGVRPCDARGALAIDALFLDQEPRDGQYGRHRELTTLIGLACPQMWETCFCTVVGGAPNGTAGLDLLLTQVPGTSEGETGYAVQVISEKGKQLAESMPGEQRSLALPEPVRKDGLPTLSSSDKWLEHFEARFWQTVGDRCLGCRVCTFVCPACRCFDVRDEVVSRQPGLQVFERLRAWDACTVSAYRRIAGGHNPRPTQLARLRNRFYCKFVYYPDDFGPLGCVGCGRCIDACPVGIDILEVVSTVEEMIAAARG